MASHQPDVAASHLGFMPLPTLLAIVTASNAEGLTDLMWNDGETIRVRYDTFLTADETHDGVEECIVDVVKVLVEGPRARTLLKLGTPGVIRADEAPQFFRPAPQDDVEKNLGEKR